MRKRHMMALLLGVGPIITIGQLATAQTTNQTMNNATMNHQGMNHQAMDHGATDAANTAAPDNGTQIPEPAGPADPGNAGDDGPPK